MEPSCEASVLFSAFPGSPLMRSSGLRPSTGVHGRCRASLPQARRAACCAARACVRRSVTASHHVGGLRVGITHAYGGVPRLRCTGRSDTVWRGRPCMTVRRVPAALSVLIGHVWCCVLCFSVHRSGGVRCAGGHLRMHRLQCAMRLLRERVLCVVGTRAGARVHACQL